MNIKKILSVLLVSVMATSALASCGNKTETTDGQVTIRIGNWADETNPKALENSNKQKAEFEAKYPNIKIVPDTYGFNVDTFYMKAAGNQLPNMFTVPFTDTKQVIDAGYAADMTDVLKDYGYDKAINPDLLELCEYDGKYYGFPYASYVTGLYINKPLFKEAGLVNEDGSIKIPQTFDEIAEFSEIIRAKTGKAGFVLPTMNNCGGWRFVNIAWNFGVTFVEKDSDGKWKATFDTQEAYDALQYIKDLKWESNAFVDETTLDIPATTKNFAVGNAAMMFSNPPSSELFLQYGMALDEVMAAKMPAGPAGRYAQMGGSAIMFSADTTPEQQDAIFKWLEFTGVSPNMTEERETKIRTSLELSREKGEPVYDREPYSLWVDETWVAKVREIRADYTNIDPADYEDYYDQTGVTQRPEPAVCAQQLYATLDGVIQEVMTNKNADVKALISQAAKDFQANHLDKM